MLAKHPSGFCFPTRKEFYAEALDLKLALSYYKGNKYKKEACEGGDD